MVSGIRGNPAQQEDGDRCPADRDRREPAAQRKQRKCDPAEERDRGENGRRVRVPEPGGELRVGGERRAVEGEGRPGSRREGHQPGRGGSGQREADVETQPRRSALDVGEERDGREGDQIDVVALDRATRLAGGDHADLEEDEHDGRQGQNCERGVGSPTWPRSDDGQPEQGTGTMSQPAANGSSAAVNPVQLSTVRGS